VLQRAAENAISSHRKSQPSNAYPHVCGLNVQVPAGVQCDYCRHQCHLVSMCPQSLLPKHHTTQTKYNSSKLIGWSLTSFFSTNTAISETKQQQVILNETLSRDSLH